MRNAGLEEAQTGIKIAGRNSTHLRYADDTTLMAKSEEELKSLLRKVKEESEKVDLRLNIKKMKIMTSGPMTSWEIDGEAMETVRDFIFGGSKITADDNCNHKIKRCLLLGRKAMTNLDSILKSRRQYFANKGPFTQSYGFSNSHVWMWELDHKEGWVPKNWCLKLWCWRRLLRLPEIKPVRPKGNQSWIFNGRTDAEAEAPIFGPPDVKSQLTEKDSDGRKDWRQEKWMTVDEMVEWHQWLNGHVFEQTLGDGERQGNLVCYTPWGHKELDTTEQLSDNLFRLIHQATLAACLSYCFLAPPNLLVLTTDAWLVFWYLS